MTDKTFSNQPLSKLIVDYDSVSTTIDSIANILNGLYTITTGELVEISSSLDYIIGKFGGKSKAEYIGYVYTDIDVAVGAYINIPQ